MKTIFTIHDDVLMEIPEVPDFVWPSVVLVKSSFSRNSECQYTHK